MTRITKYNYNAFLTRSGNQVFAENLEGTLIINLTSENFPSLNKIETKAQYLVWVKNWKTDYSRLTDRIRLLKVYLKKAKYEELAKTVTLPSYDQAKYENRVFTSSYRQEIESSLEILKRTAHKMLAARKNMKVLNYHVNVKRVN